MNPIELPAAGFHRGVPYEEYARWPAINFSKLKPIRGTASKCKWEIDNPKPPTRAMILGSSLHVAVLEPARFDGMFYICPPCDLRTVEGKEIFAKARQDAGAKEIIRAGLKDDEALLGEIGKLRGMAASIRLLKSAAPFLDGPGENECAALWRDEETGLWCKAKLDRKIENFRDVGPMVIEIKSCRDASSWGFAKDVDAFYYSAQAASYSLAVKTITGKNPLHVFIAVESAPPYDAAAYTLDDQSLQTGLLQYRQMLNRYAECVKSGNWPGYPDKVQVLSLPTYSHTRDYQN